MALQLRRTTESFISTTTLAAGEPIFSTDTHKLFIGDGVTPGGFQIGAASTGTGTNPFDQNLYTTSSVTFADITTPNTVKANRFSSKANNDQAGFSFYEIDEVTDPDTGMFSQAQGNLRFYSNGDLRVEINTNTVSVVNVDLLPYASNQNNLGSNDLRWNSLWANTLTLSQSLITDSIATGINTTSSQYTIYSFDSDLHTGAKLVIKIADGSSLQMLEMLVISDGTDVLSTQYAVLNNNGLLGTVSTALSGSDVLIRFTTCATINSAVARVCATLMT